MCQGFSRFNNFLHHFVSAKLPDSSIRVSDFFGGKGVLLDDVLTLITNS